jgi:type II secretory pathway component PulM
MAKKKAASKTTPPKASKVSVKKIISEINKTLAQVENAKASITQAQARGAGPDPRGHALDRAIMSLRGARDVIEGTCVPGFDIPF